jgi:NodT family efflux transporter outer membrane factor (OMF) lipoprotein
MVVGVGLLTSSCSLVPADNPPNSPPPSAWDAPNASGSQNVVSVHGKWWQSFGSEELTALVDRSLTGSFNLQAAAARIDEARGTAEIAGALQYPAIGLGGAAVRSTGQGSTRTQSLFAQASYEIDFWGKNRAFANSAKTLTIATAFDKDTLAVTLVSSVADTYFQILSLQERVHLAQQIAASGRRILSLIEVQAAGGIASDLQIQQQRNAVATFDAAVPALRQQLEQSVHLLAVLVGSGPEGFGIGTQNLERISLPEVEAELPASVLRQRPDIRAAEARLTSSNFDIGAARAAFYPSIVLTGQGGITSSSLSHFFPPAAVADIAASLVQPIFEGGRLQGQLKFDRAHAVELAATYRQTVDSALQDVEDALTTVAQLKELEAADLVAVESARRAFDLANAQFRLGTADFLTVLTIERTLYQAEDSLLQVHLQRLEAAVGLFRALGGGFDPPPEAAPMQSALRN